MSNLALYRKYRSKNFDELIGQEHITQSLKSSIREGRISHAYLFSGPKGVGKTSAARILARNINELTEDNEVENLDIIEIDGASNRRIDEIRELRDKVHIAPAYGKYKVYVIDEVHMLTTEAFNALLKTLEEPPSHVVFVLATTEPHKLPETIISRTQHFSFKPINSDLMVEHLKNLAKKENIDVTSDGIKILANSSNGSFRDAISMLDQLPRGIQINQEYVYNFFGIPETQLILELVHAIIGSNAEKVIESLDNITNKGISSEIIHTQILHTIQNLIRTKLRNNNTNPDRSNLSATKEYSILCDIQGKLATIPRDVIAFDHLLEAKILSLTLQNTSSTLESSKSTTTKIPDSTNMIDSIKLSRSHQSTSSISKKRGTKNSTDMNDELWLKALSMIKHKNPSLFSLLATADASFDKIKISLGFKFQFHLKKINEIKNRNLLSNVLKSITGTEYDISTHLNATISSEDVDSTQPNLEIDNVLQILGGEVVDGS
jgi:DNA polymerase III subunit gamma/tau